MLEAQPQIWTTKANFLRWSLNIFNWLIFLSGLVLLISGLLFRTVLKYDHSFIKEKIDYLSFVLTSKI